MNVNRSERRRAASCRSGASSAHGPHHDAQKLTTTGFPELSASESVNVDPSKRPSEKLGALVKGTLTTLLPAIFFCCSPNHSRSSSPTPPAPDAAAIAAGIHGLAGVWGRVSS